MGLTALATSGGELQHRHVHRGPPQAPASDCEHDAMNDIHGLEAEAAAHRQNLPWRSHRTKVACSGAAIQRHVIRYHAARSSSDGDRTLGRVERDSEQARSAVRRDEGEVDDCRGLVSGQAEPLADPVGVARDLQAADGDVGGGPD